MIKNMLPNIHLATAGWILVLVYILELMFANFLISRQFPKLPGDILIDKPGFRFYLPFVSPLIISILLSYLLGTFGK